MKKDYLHQVKMFIYLIIDHSILNLLSYVEKMKRDYLHQVKMFIYLIIDHSILNLLSYVEKNEKRLSTPNEDFDISYDHLPW